MPPSLPVLKGRDVVRIFESLGWVVARQSGSHIIMIKEGEAVTLSIPDYREVVKGCLTSAFAMMMQSELAAAQLGGHHGSHDNRGPSRLPKYT